MGNFDIVKTLDVLHDIFIGLKWKKYATYIWQTL
jgi:hypothetical protein